VVSYLLTLGMESGNIISLTGWVLKHFENHIENVKAFGKRRGTRVA